MRPPTVGSTIAAMEADPAAVGGCVGSSELTDRCDDGGQLLVVVTCTGVEFGKLGGERSVIGHELAQPDKGPHDMNAHRHGVWRIKHVGRHQGAMLGESVRRVAPPTVRAT